MRLGDVNLSKLFFTKQPICSSYELYHYKFYVILLNLANYANMITFVALNTKRIKGITS